MEMFEDGGLMDEGGTVDPVSGNDVPPGSNQEEVRDDIPAQLSEGEFVFPADVVRYFGLEHLMEMRQEAKMGLQRMEDMGQMGNSEEAIMPDNLPFDIDDLDIEEDEEYNMAQGGTVYAANGAFVPQQTGVARTAVQAASANPQLRGTRYTPNPVKIQTPTFQETVGPGVIGVNYEMVEYVNATGQTILLRKDKTTGQMLDPIPEGFTLKSEQTKSDVTTPTTVETAQVTDTGYEGRDEDVPSGASIALGGKTVGPASGLGIPGTRFAGPSKRVTGSTQYNVGFKNVGLGSMLSPAAFSYNMIKKDGGIPSGSSAVLGVKGNRKATVELPAIAYNSLRNDPRGQQAKAVQEALAARDALTSGSNTSYKNGVLSVEDKNGNMVEVSKDAIDLIGKTMYSEIKAEADGTFGFGRTDNLVDTARDYYSGMSDQEEKNARDALSAYNDQQFADFDIDDNNNDEPGGGGGYGGGDSPDGNAGGSTEGSESVGDG